MSIIDGYKKVIETVVEIDALYTACKQLVLRHPELADDLAGAFAAVVKTVATKNVTGALAVLAAVQGAYTDAVKAYTDETASGAVADLVKKLHAIAE